jgi:hypothetical protein
MPDSPSVISTSPLTGQLHLSTNLSVVDFDRFSPQGPTSASGSLSPITTLLPVHSQIASLSDPSAITTVAIPRVDEDRNASSQLELTHYPQQPEQSLSNVVTTVLSREDGGSSESSA